MYRICCLIICVSLLACGNDTSQKSNIVDTEINKLVIKKDTTLDEPPTLTLKELKEKTEKAKVVAQETEKEAIEESKFKDEPCDLLIDTYKKAISLLTADKNSKEGRDLYRSFRNDPIMNKCREMQENKSTFKELDKAFHGRNRK
jgi:hypothetical protein